MLANRTEPTSISLSRNHKSVALVGVTTSTDNYGVRVLLSSAIKALADAFPNTQIKSLDYGFRPTRHREPLGNGYCPIRVLNIRFGGVTRRNNVFRLLGLALFTRIIPRRIGNALKWRNPLLRRLMTIDAYFAISGGDSFSDIYGMRRFVYVTAPQLLVLALGKPLIQLPQTLGPYRSWLARRTAKFILMRSRLRYARDAEGADTVRRLLPVNTPEMRVMPDIGLSMPPEPLPTPVLTELLNLRSSGTVVGLNISSLLYMGGYDQRNMFGLHENFPEFVDKVISGIAEVPHVELLLVPHVCGGPNSEEDETRLCEALAAQHGGTHRKVRYIDAQLNHKQMKALIGACDVFVGARMHACIAAVSQSVPTVCLAYSDKFAGVMAPLGMGARVVDLRKAGASETLRAFHEVYSIRSALRTELGANLRQLPSLAADLRAAMPELDDIAAASHETSLSPEHSPMRAPLGTKA